MSLFIYAVNRQSLVSISNCLILAGCSGPSNKHTSHAGGSGAASSGTAALQDFFWGCLNTICIIVNDRGNGPQAAIVLTGLGGGGYSTEGRLVMIAVNQKVQGERSTEAGGRS